MHSTTSSPTKRSFVVMSSAQSRNNVGRSRWRSHGAAFMSRPMDGEMYRYSGTFLKICGMDKTRGSSTSSNSRASGDSCPNDVFKTRDDPITIPATRSRAVSLSILSKIYYIYALVRVLELYIYVVTSCFWTLVFYIHLNPSVSQ